MAHAQKDPTAAADEAFNSYRYSVAIERYKKKHIPALKATMPKKNRINFQLGECYRLTNNLRRALLQYKKLIREGYETIEPELMLNYADVLKSDEQYDEALKFYTQYTEQVPEDPRGPNGVESCKLAIEWASKPSKHEIEVLKKTKLARIGFFPHLRQR